MHTMPATVALFRMVKHFLPEWFIESEYDGLKLLLLCSRLLAKVDVAKKQIQAQFKLNIGLAIFNFYLWL